MDFSIIIPSKKPENLCACIAAIMQCEPNLDPARIIVIDDGARARAAGKVPNVTWITGVQPFIFARNVNLGITFAPAHQDLILLNDDALLKTQGGFSALSEAAQYRWGLVSASTNFGNICQAPTGFPGVREDRTHVPSFICVYVPRETIKTVGLMDERFGPAPIYGYCDNDYIRRTRAAGLRVGIFDPCFVDHSQMKVKGTFVELPNGRDIRLGRAVYDAKWGKEAI
jgi:glycosyltransferase involved in cell wall biosynthesis